MRELSNFRGDCTVPDEILNIVKNDLREGCSMPIIKLILKNTDYHHIIKIYHKYIAE